MAGWDGTGGATGIAHSGYRFDLHALSLTSSGGDFHEGFSYQVLWPLQHDCIEGPAWREDWWDHHVAVNARYAERAAELVARGGAAWVHDYDLQLVPGMLRVDGGRMLEVAGWSGPS